MYGRYNIIHLWSGLFEESKKKNTQFFILRLLDKKKGYLNVIYIL